MRFKSGVLSVYLYLPSGSCRGYTVLLCFSRGRFLRIILLVAAYRTLLKTQECWSCSTEGIVSLSAVGFSFCAWAGVAGGAEHPHPVQPTSKALLRRDEPPSCTPPKNTSFSAGMGGCRGCKQPQHCWGAGCGFGSPAVCSAPCSDAAKGSGGVCSAVGPHARGMENRHRGFALAFTRSWIQPLIPLPGPLLLSAIKLCVSLKVNDEAVHLSWCKANFRP